MISLITGGAGFIGSHLADRLLSMGHEVIALDNFDNYYDPAVKRQNIAHNLENQKYRLIEGSILDKDLLKKIIREEGIDYIFHNAAQAGVRISVENPLKPHDINATGTLFLLKETVDSGIRKFINASSSSVYGKTVYLPFDEEHPKNPVSPYGVSKLAAEHYSRVFYEIYGLQTTSLRYFTVYGPRMRPDLAISIFTRNALKNEPVTVFGDGEKSRDFTYIDDIVEANILAMKKGNGEEFNIGSGSRITINELAEKILEITGSRSSIIHSKSQKGDAEHTWAKNEKAKKMMGWAPKTNIDDGIKKFIDYIKE